MTESSLAEVETIRTDGGRYRLERGWAKVPAGFSFRSVSSVAVDRNDNVYVFNRGDNPVVVFDRKGNMLASWGHGQFKNPHGIHIGRDDGVYCTDDGDHTVRKFTLDGKLLMTIGTPGEPAPAYSGKPFNRCTHTALSPENDIYVSDGYRNSRLHKFSPEGKLITSWGEPGVRAGELNVAHNVCCDEDGWVYVADRENHRIQVFDGNGKYQTQWVNLHRAAWIYAPPERDPLFYVAELGPELAINRPCPNLGPRISLFTNEGKPVTRIHAEVAEGTPPTPFAVPHGLVVDSHGDIYVADLAQQKWAEHYPDLSQEGFESLKKLVCLEPPSR